MAHAQWLVTGFAECRALAYCVLCWVAQRLAALPRAWHAAHGSRSPFCVLLCWVTLGWGPPYASPQCKPVTRPGLPLHTPTQTLRHATTIIGGCQLNTIHLHCEHELAPSSWGVCARDKSHSSPPPSLSLRCVAKLPHAKTLSDGTFSCPAHYCEVCGGSGNGREMAYCLGCVPGVGGKGRRGKAPGVDVRTPGAHSTARDLRPGCMV